MIQFHAHPLHRTSYRNNQSVPARAHGSSPADNGSDLSCSSSSSDSVASAPPSASKCLELIASKIIRGDHKDFISFFHVNYLEISTLPCLPNRLHGSIASGTSVC